MLKKLVSLLLSVTVVICALSLSAAAKTAPDFLKKMPVPQYLLFSTSTDKSLDYLSVEVAVPQDFSYFKSVNSEKLYSLKGDFYIQFDWSIDECSWSYSKDWDNVSHKDAITYKLNENLIQKFDIFDVTLDSDKNRFSQGIKLENGRDAFYYPEHELSVRARYIFSYTDDSAEQKTVYSEWSEGFSVNDDYYNKNSRNVEIYDFGAPSVVDSVSLNHDNEQNLSSFMFDWFFDGTIEDVAFNIYAINKDHMKIQEQVFVGKNGRWIDVSTIENPVPYDCGTTTVPVDDEWLSEDNYFKYRFRYYYEGDPSNGLFEFSSAWSSSIIYDNGKVTVTKETTESADIIGDESTEPIEKLEHEKNVTSPIVYIILIFVLLCFFFGLLTSIGETRRQRKALSEKPDQKKDKKRKNKK